MVQAAQTDSAFGYVEKLLPDEYKQNEGKKMNGISKQKLLCRRMSTEKAEVTNGTSCSIRGLLESHGSVRSLLNSDLMTVSELLTLDKQEGDQSDQDLAYYHSSCDRQEAERILTAESDTASDGLFILRDCSSVIKRERNEMLLDYPMDQAVWRFCLSVRCSKRCYHYRISSVNHCVFSIEGKSRSIHGIDELIRYYHLGPHGMITALKEFCPGGKSPPAICRKYGRDNLLHRACSEGDAETVGILLKHGCSQKSNWRSTSCPELNHCHRQTLLLDVNQKDNNGATALHEAAYLGRDDIVKLLLDYGANVTMFDAFGCTPVHRAVQGNHPMTLHMLVSAMTNRLAENTGNLYRLSSTNLSFGSKPLDEFVLGVIHLRNPYSLWLPLHDAACHSSLECIRILLEDFKSPQCPRSVDDVVPLELAHTNTGGSIESESLCKQTAECYDYLLQHRPTNDLPADLCNESNWLHGNIGRRKANYLLEQAAKTAVASDEYSLSGSVDRKAYFLIRQSDEKNFDGFILSLLLPSPQKFSSLGDWPTSPCHFKIESIRPTKPCMIEWCKTAQDGNFRMYAINDGPYFLTLTDLVSHYHYLADGLPGRLVYAVNQQIVTQIEESVNRQPESELEVLRRKRFNSSDEIEKSTFQHNTIVQTPEMQRHNGGFNDRLALQSIPQQQSQLGGSKGGSSFNLNCQQLRLISLDRIQALRLLGEGEFGCVWEGRYLDERGKQIGVAVKVLKDISDESRKEFLREALIMGQLKHPCVVRIHGIVNDVNLMMIQELLPKGSMLEFCRRNNLQDDILKTWATQIAQGMAYMEKKGFVHRDLAARNVLVASIYQVKVSDFGLSRATVNSVYSQTTPGKIPVKWYAPEAIEFGRFTSKSDVWSYGVTLWEMFSGGRHPYGEATGPEVLKMIKQDKRLERPSRCPLSTYQLMLTCWLYNEHRRPNFSEINRYFQNDPDYQAAVRSSLPGCERSAVPK